MNTSTPTLCDRLREIGGDTHMRDRSGRKIGLI